MRVVLCGLLALVQSFKCLFENKNVLPFPACSDLREKRTFFELRALGSMMKASLDYSRANE
jgi:hypothetical protein